MSGNNFSAVVSRGKSTTLIVNRQIWKKSSTRYTGIGKDTDSVSCKILVRRLIFNSPLSMSFPGLYNQVTPVSTERITLPTAAVLTHVLHLLMNLLMYVRTYCTYYYTYCTRTYYNLLLSCTYYVLTYVRTVLMMDVPIYSGVYWKKK